MRVAVAVVALHWACALWVGQTTRRLRPPTLDESMAEVDAERSNSIVIPDRSANGYLWYAVPAAATGPTMIMITDNFIAPDFVEQAGTVQDADGNEYRVAVTHNLLSR